MDSKHYQDLLKKITDGASYRVASEDPQFLASENLRGLRLQLELLKVEEILREQDIQSTIVVFGSARIDSPEVANERLRQLTCSGNAGTDPGKARELEEAQRKLAYSSYYEHARRFSAIISRHFQQANKRDFVIVTGGGPGIMEAANRGAFDVGEHSIGLNITLPHEQHPNPFITPELAFRFHYFAVRKMHFLLRARALVAFPGGYGTLDELFEVLTLIQTHKMARIPILLFGSKFWEQAVNFDFLVQEGMIAAADARLFSVVDTAEDAVAILLDFYKDVAV